MEEELERKVFYRKNYNDVKIMDQEAEAFAKKKRIEYPDCLVSKEYINAVDILVRVTTVRQLYRSDRLIERQRIRERERTKQRSRSRDFSRSSRGRGRGRSR